MRRNASGLCCKARLRVGASQALLFPRRIRDDLSALEGATGPRLVRADDGLLYVAKDEAVVTPPAPTVRASEYFWLSVAQVVGLTCASPEILEWESGRLVVGVREEHSAVGRTRAACEMALLSGNVLDGGAHLSRIFIFDLFCANWDRHPGNYLVLDQGGQLVAFAIDFSHVTVSPSDALTDPMTATNNMTRVYFPILALPYGGPDHAAALVVLDRLAALRPEHVGPILTGIPPDWLPAPQKDAVLSWWEDGRCAARIEQLREGVRNGTLM